MVNLALDHIILSQFASEEQGDWMYGDVRFFSRLYERNCEVLEVNSTFSTMS